ncbi:hypothetical protein H2248_008724 [Termitomyces sp. 'cryptogamus']|nr:hypothetical protein H2248_008724 [Termitomyces sp. 'cryptogamus']
MWYSLVQFESGTILDIRYTRPSWRVQASTVLSAELLKSKQCVVLPSSLLISTILIIYILSTFPYSMDCRFTEVTIVVLINVAIDKIIWVIRVGDREWLP